MHPQTSRRLLGRHSTLAYCGDMSRTTQHRFIKDGTFPPGIAITLQNLAWFQHELDRWNAALARGATNDELRELVKKMMAERVAEAEAA